MTAPTTPGPRNTEPLGGDPRRLAAIVVLAWQEIRDGRRPLRQIAHLLSPAVERRLAAGISSGASPHHGRTRIRRVVTHAVARQAYEAVVLVERAERVTAVAIRLERHLGHWRIVELASPEDGFAPLPTASLPDDHRCRDAFDEVAAEIAADGPV